jgi:hypothetical protein
MSLTTINKCVILSLTLTSMIMLTSYTVLYGVCISTHTVSLNNSLITVHEITLNVSSKKVTRAGNIPVLLGCGALSLGTCAWYDGFIVKGIKCPFRFWKTRPKLRAPITQYCGTTAAEQGSQFCCQSLKFTVRYITIIFCRELFLWRIRYFYWCWDKPHKNTLYFCIISCYVADYPQKRLHECQHTMFHQE